MGNASSAPWACCGPADPQLSAQKTLPFHRIINEFDDESTAAHVLALCEAFRKESRDVLRGSSKVTRVGQLRECGQATLLQCINERNSKGRTPLHIAGAVGLLKTVRVLLTEGADPYIQDVDGLNPLHYATRKRQGKVVMLLLQHTSHRGEGTSAHELGPHDHAVAYILPHRYLNSTTSSHLTPLHIAVSSGYLQLVKALLTHYTPDLTKCTIQDTAEHAYVYPAGTSPLHIAATTGNREMAHALLTYYAANTQNNQSEPIVDPRTLYNSKGQQPWQVAYALPMRHLSQLLHPETPLSQLWLHRDSRPEDDDMPSLQRLAVEVYRLHLLATLTPAPSPGSARGLVPSPPPSALQIGRTTLSRQNSAKQLPSDAIRHQLQLASASTGMLQFSDIVAHLNVQLCTISEQPSLDRSSRQHSAPPPAKLMAGMGEVDAEMEITGQNRSQSGIEVDDMCGVCWTNGCDVRFMPCEHKICHSCAEQMVQRIQLKPVCCPFCREPACSFALGLSEQHV